MKKYSVYRKGIIVVAVIIALSAALTGCSKKTKLGNTKNPAFASPSQVEYATTVVKKGSISLILATTGTVSSYKQQNLAFPDLNNAHIKNIFAGPDEIVEPGMVIADTDYSEYDSALQQQEVEYRKAQIACEKVKAERGSQSQIKIAEAEVEVQRLKLEELMAKINKGRLISNVFGQIIYMAAMKAGDTVAAGTPLSPGSNIITIAALDGIMIRCTGNDVDKFKTGMKVDVVVNGKSYPGEVVTDVKAYPSSTGNSGYPSGDALSAGITVSENPTAVVVLKKVPPDIAIGMSVDVKIELAKKDNVIVIMKKYVRQNAGHNYVEVLEDGIKVEKYVELGLENNDYVEVVNGLDAEELLIMN